LRTSRGLLPRLNPRNWSSFALRIVLPAVLAIVLFIIAIFLILIPSAEDQLLEGKKATAQELTRAAVSILDEYYTEEVSGSMTREQAQEEAARTIALAKQKGEEVVARDAIVQAAQARSEQILAQARSEAEVTRRDGDDYVIETLRGLEAEITRLQNQARNGIAKLAADRQKSLEFSGKAGVTED